MFRTLAKFLLPLLGGSGIVALTMHLTNTSKGLFDSMKLLDIQHKPEVDEDEIVPKVEPEQQSSPSPSQPSESNGQDDSQNSDQNSSQDSSQSSEQSPQAQSQASTASTSGNTSWEDVIKFCALTIDTQTASWTSETGYSSLKNIHQLSQTITKFLNAAQMSQAAQNSAASTEGTEQKK